MPTLQDDIADLAMDLMAYRSTADNPDELDACMDHAADYFADDAFDVERYDVNGTPSVVVTYDGTTAPRVLLHGHLDVVPVTDADDPEQVWTPAYDGETLSGRGSADMKAGVASLMRAVRDMADDEPDIALMLAGDEELGGFDGARHFANEEVYTPDVAITAEPDTVSDAGLDVVTHQKGVFWVDATAYGEGSHGSRPWNGENAATMATDWYGAVRDRFPDIESEDDWRTSINLGMLRAGESYNTVPSTAEMNIDIRYTADLGPDDALRIMQDVDGVDVALADETDDPAAHDVVLDVADDTPALSTPQDHPDVELLQDISRDVTGEQSWTRRETGASDMAFFGAQGIPAVTFGPRGRNLHRPDEHLDATSLVDHYDAVTRFVRQVAD